MPWDDENSNLIGHASFIAGYSAASAQSHAQVTRAVEMALKSASDLCETTAKWNYSMTGKYRSEELKIRSECLEDQCTTLADDIRALDVPTLVAAAMAEAGGEGP